MSTHRYTIVSLLLYIWMTSDYDYDYNKTNRQLRCGARALVISDRIGARTEAPPAVAVMSSKSQVVTRYRGNVITVQITRTGPARTTDRG